MKSLKKDSDYDLFISFSNADLFFALELYRDLLQAGVQPFLYEISGQASEDFWKKIRQVIEQVDVFCLIDSRNARRSSWVIRECQLALELFNKGKIKHFIPCVIDPIEDLTNPDRYMVTKGNLEQLEQLVPNSVSLNLRKINGKLFLNTEHFLQTIEPGSNTGQSWHQEVLERCNTSNIFKITKGLNNIRFYYKTHFDHDEVYYDGLRRILNLTAETRGTTKEFEDYHPETADFDQELRDFNISGPQRNRLMYDFSYFVNRDKGDLKAAATRLDLIEAECGSLGYVLKKENIVAILKKTPYDQELDQIASKLYGMQDKMFGTLEAFETYLHRKIGTEHFSLYKALVREHVTVGVRLVSVALARAFLYYEKEDQQKAYEELLAITREFKEDARGWFARAKQEMEFGRFFEAENSLDQALALINKYKDNNYYQNHKYLVLYHKITTQLKLKRGPEAARKTFDAIDVDHRIFPEVKAAEIRVLTAEHRFEEAGQRLNRMSIAHQEEVDNWSSYKLTHQKLGLLAHYIRDKIVSERLEPLVNVLYPNKQSLLNKLKDVFSDMPDRLKEHEELILRQARYTREFSIDRYLLADLSYKLCFKIIESKAMKYLDLAYACLQRCAALFPEEYRFTRELHRMERAYGPR